MKTHIHLRIHVVLLFSGLLVLALTGCGSEPLHPYSYRQPKQVDDGFEIGSLAQANLLEPILPTAAAT